MTSPATPQPDLRPVAFTDPDARTLIGEADAYNTTLYGHPDATPIQSREFDPEHGGVFLIAYHNNRLAGCGGYRRNDGQGPSTAEIKRVYTRPSARRTGIGRALLSELENHARNAGYTRIILDVGSKQTPAHLLYESCGYTQISGFSMYRDRPGNRAYAKNLMGECENNGTVNTTAELRSRRGRSDLRCN